MIEDLRFKNGGQTLLEAIIALSVLLMMLSAIVIAVVVSVNNSAFVKLQNQANKYAQEGIEYIRNLKKTDYKTYQTISEGDSVTYCLDQDFQLSGVSPCPVNVGAFKREIRFEVTPSCVSGKEIKVTVWWASGKCKNESSGPYCHKAEMSSCLADNE